MNSDQLLKFKAIAEHRTLTEAAESLFISQSALSHALAALENELKCKLFSRENGKLLKLTKDGTKLLEYANAVTGLLDQAQLSMKENDTISIPAVNFLSTFILSEYPNEDLHKIKFVQTREEKMPELLYKGDLDVAICDDYHFNKYLSNHKGLAKPRKTIICKEQLALLVKEGDPFYNVKSLSYLDCGQTPMVIQSSGATLIEWLEIVKYICNYEFNCVFSIDYYSFDIIRDKIDFPQVIILNSIINPISRITSKKKHRVVPINDTYSKRDIYLWYLDYNEERIEPLLTSIKKYYKRS